MTKSGFYVIDKERRLQTVIRVHSMGDATIAFKKKGMGTWDLIKYDYNRLPRAVGITESQKWALIGQLRKQVAKAKGEHLFKVIFRLFDS